MRNIIGVVSVVVTLAAVGGCASQRLQLSKSDPPKNAPKPEERVKYGFPWSKPKPEPQVASTELPPELAEQLAKSRVTSPKTGVPKEALQRAADAEARGDLDSARAAYLQVVESDPKNVEAHHRLGVIADMRQDPQTADQHYAQAYALNRRDADLLCDMGYSLLLRGRFADSERRLKEALDINAYHRAALSNLGLVYGKMGRYDEALAMFRQAGTESEAQRNIATLFPNGKPGSRPNATAIADARTTPFPATAAPTAGIAPAMPTDIDQRLIGLANDPVQPRNPAHQTAPQSQTLSQVGGLQPSFTPQPPAMQPQGNPFAPPMNTAQPAVAAKPAGTGNPWSGSLANPLSSTDVAAFAAPQQPPMNANPYAMPPGNAPPANNWNQQPPAR